jgi:hypothetical protein
MAWETRRPGGPRYYTRTRRLGGGRWRREYLGTGPKAAAAASADARERAGRQAQAAERRAERLRQQETDALLRELDQAVDVLVHAALLAGGLHKHGGEWRRSHGSGSRGATS